MIEMNTAYIKAKPKTDQFAQIGFDKDKWAIHILKDDQKGVWILTNHTGAYEFIYDSLQHLETEWEWEKMWRE